MKIILLQDVKALGKKGQVVEVSDGYARNYILPKKIGMLADNTNMNNLKLQSAKEERVAKEQLEQAQNLAKEIESKVYEVFVKVGEGGKTFGAISSKEIAKAALTQHGLDIDKKKIQLAEPLKAMGSYDVPVKLHPKVTASMKVVVKEEK